MLLCSSQWLESHTCRGLGIETSENYLEYTDIVYMYTDQKIDSDFILCIFIIIVYHSIEGGNTAPSLLVLQIFGNIWYS